VILKLNYQDNITEVNAGTVNLPLPGYRVGHKSVHSFFWWPRQRHQGRRTTQTLPVHTAEFPEEADKTGSGKINEKHIYSLSQHGHC
jgi:hypothetical protein